MALSDRGDWLPYETRRKYAVWRKAVRDLTLQLNLDPDFRDAEDLGDWVDMVSTLMSFAPEPGPEGDNEFPETRRGGEPYEHQRAGAGVDDPE